MKKIAVTGSNGFIGSHLIPFLLKEGYQVVHLSRSHGIDIMDFRSIQDVPECEAIIHLAAKTYVPDSFNYPREFYEFNIGSTLNVLELARKWRARVIYMSSYFYGSPQYIPVDEQHPLCPHNPYAQAKMMAEELCRAYYRDFKVPTLSLRLFNIYGPGQKGSFLIPEILEKVKLGNIILKDPRPKRDYIHVFDVVRVIGLCLDTEFKSYDVFNLATGVSYSVEEIVNLVGKYSPIPFTVSYSHEYRKGEVLDAVGNAEKLKKFIGLKCFMNLEEGLENIVS
jgi:UDP-glucose 4-epimerase